MIATNFQTEIQIHYTHQYTAGLRNRLCSETRSGPRTRLRPEGTDGSAVPYFPARPRLAKKKKMTRAERRKKINSFWQRTQSIKERKKTECCAAGTAVRDEERRGERPIVQRTRPNTDADATAPGPFYTRAALRLVAAAGGDDVPPRAAGCSRGRRRLPRRRRRWWRLRWRWRWRLFLTTGSSQRPRSRTHAHTYRPISDRATRRCK